MLALLNPGMANSPTVAATDAINSLRERGSILFARQFIHIKVV
jgi:hypothetical protein